MKLVITASILVSDGSRNIDANTNQTEFLKDELESPSLGNQAEEYEGRVQEVNEKEQEQEQKREEQEDEEKDT